MFHTERNLHQQYTEADHLRAAVEWLERAQDAASDGGVVGRYRLNVGWTSSYPETTGYIVPTFLRLADELGEPGFRRRAERAVGFLLGLQLASGAFPGGEINENRERPSPFNTAQILHGLIEWHAATGDAAALRAARRAGDWLLTVQDEDGAFRRHFYNDCPATYSAHLSCWLAQLGRQTGEDRFLQAVERHVDWVLEHADPATGWFDCMGFDEAQHHAQHAFTHTVAYTVWGLLYSADILGRRDAFEAATTAAAGIARRLELSRRLPGRLAKPWRADGDFCCLTGNAQMALIWMHLFRRTQDVWWLNPAFKAIDEVKLHQPMENPNPGIRGGIPGSFPAWGDYIYGGIPNWGAKYFIDALLEKRSILRTLSTRIRPAVPGPLEPTILPPAREGRPARIVVLTRAGSRRLAHFAAAWEKLGVQPAAVVFEHARSAPLTEDLAGFVRRNGLRAVPGRLLRRAAATEATARAGDAPLPPTAEAFCRERGIVPITVPPLTDLKAVEAVRQLAPDLLVQAGVGILRGDLLQVPKLGIVNVHMSLLPGYRGMSVAEWAALNGHPQGCTVHLIERGIDTGDVLLRRPVNVSGCRSVAELRARIDQAQAETLAQVLAYVARTGALPPREPQAPEAGRQYFAMHEELRRCLDAELAARPAAAEPASEGQALTQGLRLRR